MKESQSEVPEKFNISLIGIVSAMAGLLFGFDTGVISGAQEFLFNTFGVGEGNTLYFEYIRGIVVAAVPIGALFGAIISGKFAQGLGRRKTLMLTAVMFTVGTLTAAFAPSLHVVIAGRLIMGLAIGISAMVAPMYLGEVSPPEVRGTMIFLFQLAITVGLLSAFGINLLFASLMTDHTLNWRWMFGVAIIPSVLLFFGMFKMPFSPRWLIMKGRVDEAKTILQKLLGKLDIGKELDEIDESMRHDTGHNWVELFKKPLLPLLAVTFGLFVFQQLSGINAIMYYGPRVFANAGFGENAKYMAQLVMGVTNVLATVLGVWIVDKAGRRPLLFVGFSGMIICLGLLAYFLESNQAHPMASLVSILFYIIFFAISLGGVPYILMSEVFPLKSRSMGMAIASCANWGFNILVSSTFEILVTELGGMGNVFLLYGICTIVGFIVAMRFVPETKNRHLEQLEHNLYAGKLLRHLGDPIED